MRLSALPLQWLQARRAGRVLSLPWELRGLAATRPGVPGAMDRIFAQEIARLTKRLAGRIDGAETGSISIFLRAGKSGVPDWVALYIPE